MSTLRHLAPVSPSKLACLALGYKPDGVRGDKSGHCALCGQAIQPGDLRNPFRVSASFVDYPSLAVPSSTILCEWCPALMTRDGLAQSGYGVFSADGFKPFRKWDDIRTALLDPPQPPFIMVRATANNQHMCWRAPVSYSRDLLIVRVGLRDVTIRRALVMEALAAGDRLAKKALAEAKPSGKGKLPKIQNPDKILHPFISLSPDLKMDGDTKAGHGQLRSNIVSAPWAKEDPYASDIKLLRSLTLGETWALRFVLFEKKKADA